MRICAIYTGTECIFYQTIYIQVVCKYHKYINHITHII